MANPGLSLRGNPPFPNGELGEYPSSDGVFAAVLFVREHASAPTGDWLGNVYDCMNVDIPFVPASARQDGHAGIAVQEIRAYIRISTIRPREGLHISVIFRIVSVNGKPVNRGARIPMIATTDESTRNQATTLIANPLLLDWDLIDPELMSHDVKYRVDVDLSGKLIGTGNLDVHIKVKQ